MNEGQKGVFTRIGVGLLAVWAVSASIAAGIGWARCHSAETRLAEIRAAPADTELRANLDAISKRNAELEQSNAGITAELVNAERFIRDIRQFAERGRGLISDARQTTLDIRDTVSRLQDRDRRFTSFARQLLDLLERRAPVGGRDGAAPAGK